MPNLLCALRRMDQPTTVQDMVEVKHYEMALIEGHCGKDPSTRFTNAGKSIASCSVAVSWGKRGEPDQKTEWVEIIAWEDKGEILSQFSKGDAILVAGKLGLNRWTGNDGVERVTGQLTAWEIARPDHKKKGESGQGESKPKNQSQSQQNRSGSDMPPVGGGEPEDIPFSPHIW